MVVNFRPFLLVLFFKALEEKKSTPASSITADDCWLSWELVVLDYL